jgi:hypothetical protein
VQKRFWNRKLKKKKKKIQIAVLHLKLKFKNVNARILIKRTIINCSDALVQPNFIHDFQLDAKYRSRRAPCRTIVQVVDNCPSL